MRNYITFLLLLASIIASSQKAIDDTKQFLNDFFAKEALRGNLRFTQGLDSSTIDQLVKTLSYGNADSTWTSVNYQRVVFEMSCEEKVLIRNTWLAQYGKNWKNDIMENAAPYVSIRFSPDATREEKEKFIASYQQKTVVSFSQPVFLRDKSYCVFFRSISYDILGGGGGELFVLKRDGEKWEHYLTKTMFFH